MSTFSITELRGLDGRKLAEAWFDRPGAIEASWHWVQTVIASKFECDPEDVDCVEPDEDDECGDDFATVGGKRVARIHHRFPQSAQIADRVFSQAAE